jgi:hypothetical protein
MEAPFSTVVQLIREAFTERSVSAATYDAAVSLLGVPLLIDLITLDGTYASTAALLKVFEMQLEAGGIPARADLESPGARYWQILLKKSKIEWLQNSRECQFLVVSAARSLCRTCTKIIGRFCANRCGRSLRQIQVSRGEGVLPLCGSLAKHRLEYVIPLRCADAISY